jgi:hypothetical protein
MLPMNQSQLIINVIEAQAAEARRDQGRIRSERPLRGRRRRRHVHAPGPGARRRIALA